VEAVHSPEAFGRQQAQSAAERSREAALARGPAAGNSIEGARIADCL